MPSLRRSAVALCGLAMVCGTAPSAAAPHDVTAGVRPVFAHDGHARLPYQVRRQHVWLRARIAARDSVWVVLDTGASASVLDQRVAERLGLEWQPGPMAMGAGGMQPSRRIADVRLDLGGVSFRWPEMVGIDLADLERATGRPMDVVLGYELFRSCVVRFDPAAGMVDLWEPKRAPKRPPGTSVPLTLIGHHPYVDAELTVPGRAPLRGPFVLDTGASSALIVNPSVVQRDSLVAAFPRTLTTLARGVGGEVRNRVARAERLTIGDLAFDEPTVLLPDPTLGHISAPGTAGNIGGEVMGRCRVTFDYPRSTVIFEPLPGFHAPFESNMSGMAVVPADGGFEVRYVDERTPASEADVRVGDLIVSIDGRDATSVDPVALRELLATEDHVLRLGLRRGGEPVDVTLKLRRIL